MKRFVSIPVVLLKTRTGYDAFSPLVTGCVATDKTIDRTLKRMAEALEFHLEGERLVKHGRISGVKTLLRRAFDDYGTDALYASLDIAA